MTARLRSVGLFALWMSGCAQTLVIGAMNGDSSLDASAPLDATGANDGSTSPDAPSPIDRAQPADATSPSDSTPLDATADLGPTLDASPRDVADVTITDAPHADAMTADARDAADVTVGPAGTPLPAGWCAVGDRCYVDPGVFQVANSAPFVDACTAPGAQRILVGADDEAATVPLPFEFRYASRRYTQVGVSSNGAIGFPTVLPLAANEAPPYRPMGDAVFPMWIDMRQPMGVCVATLGTAPDRRFVIEYVDARRADAPDFSATIEVSLHEGTNTVSSQVYRSTGALGFPTVGYQELGGRSSGVRYGPSYPLPPTTISFQFQFTTRVTEGVGVCHAGAIACGASGDAVCTGMVAPSGEVCNGLDDDCDGEVDECASCGASRVCMGGRCACPPDVACDGVPIAGVATGLSNSCAWRTDGTVACWGSNVIGDGCAERRPFPTAIPGLRGVTQVAMNGNHICARRGNGTVACWGSNTYGELGDGTNTRRLSPVEVPGITDAASVFVAGDATCAFTASGATRCWGSNLTAQVGDGTTSHRSSPVPITGLTDTASMAGLFGHTCALRATGGVVCWGLNRFGAIGEGTDTLYLLTPTPVIGMADGVTQIGVGGGASFALRDNRLYMWGLNSAPYVPSMMGAPEIRSPVELTAFGRVSRIHVIGQAIFAWREDGSVLVFSRNDDGQVGNGTNSPVLTPTPAPYLAGMRIGPGGGSHACALRDDGSLWCWGNNREGQIGDGTTTPRYSPVRISL